jgi:nucleoside-diphosphate-sugar epimerase
MDASNGSLDSKNMTILVTGGAGYVGSILIRRLLNQGYRVICVDNLRYGGNSLLDVWGHPRFELRKIDITHFEEMDSVFNEYAFSALVHLAAIVGDPACKLEPELARHTNWDASVHLLEKARQSKVTRFIFASTCSNYGKMDNSQENFLDETSPLAPVSLYAELKVEFENYLLHNTSQLAGFSPTVLRFSTVFGISPRMRFDLTVNEFTKELALGRKLTVFGEQFWRPYCYVGDFSTAILSVLNAPEEQVAYNVFNVGDSSQNYTKKMLVEELLRLVPEAQVEYVHKTEDPRDYRVSFEKIKNDLGFAITKTVPVGMADILSCLNAGIIPDPDNQRFYNIPRRDA